MLQSTRSYERRATARVYRSLASRSRRRRSVPRGRSRSLSSISKRRASRSALRSASTVRRSGGPSSVRRRANDRRSRRGKDEGRDRPTDRGRRRSGRRRPPVADALEPCSRPSWSRRRVLGPVHRLKERAFAGIELSCPRTPSEERAFVVVRGRCRGLRWGDALRRT